MNNGSAEQVINDMNPDTIDSFLSEMEAIKETPTRSLESVEDELNDDETGDVSVEEEKEEMRHPLISAAHVILENDEDDISKRFLTVAQGSGRSFFESLSLLFAGASLDEETEQTLVAIRDLVEGLEQV